MACTSPLSGWVTERGFVFGAGPNRIACGQCMDCRLERSRQWAVRCMHESRMHESNCFITLTYDDEHLPEHGNLNYAHFQAFMRRLRKRYDVRFYMCGEYGDTTQRPHYHACLFGIDFKDREPYRMGGSGFLTYTSEELQSFWPHGHAWCGDFSFETAGYCARYITKKLTGAAAMMSQFRVDLSTGEIFERVPEFTQMSRKPGIGRPFYDKFASDFFPHDRVIVRGKETMAPRYYARIYRKAEPDEWAKIVVKRQRFCVGKEGTVGRRRARSIVTLARFNLLPRKEI